MLRALASHQCGLGLNLGADSICGLSLLVLSLAVRDFSSGTPVSPLLKNQQVQIPFDLDTFTPKCSKLVQQLQINYNYN